MGIAGLMQIVRKHSQLPEVKLSKYHGRTISQDAMISIYKSKIALINQKGAIMKRKDGKVTTHLFGILMKTMMYLKQGILPVWVFDGIPPDLKQGTIQERRERKDRAKEQLKSEDITVEERLKLTKRTISVTTEETEELKLMFQLMGIPVVQALKDAEAQCAANDISQTSYGTMTDDSDYLLFGGPVMIKSMSKQVYTEVKLAQVLKDLGLTHPQLIDLAILMGSDYCVGIQGVTPTSLFKIFKANGKTIEGTLKFMKQSKQYKIPLCFEELYPKIREYYLRTRVVNPHSIKPQWNEPQYDKFKAFLTYYEFNKNSINTHIAELKLLYKKHRAISAKGP